MKKQFLLVAFLAIAFGAFSQIQNPVSWEFKSKKIDATTYELHITAEIDKGWHIYTIDHASDIGIATSLDFQKNPLGVAEGKVKVIGKPIAMKDPSTGENVKFYEKTVTFVQTIKLKAPVKTSFSGGVEFMACDDKQCLPPTTKQFKIAIQ